MELTSMERWFPALATLAGAILLGYLTRVLVVRRLSMLFARTATDLDDLVLAALKRHLPFWFLLAGVAMAVRMTPLSERAMLATSRLCAVGLVLSLTLAASSFGCALLGRFTRRAGATRKTTSLVQNALRVMIIMCGVLLVLANLGISITPLITALGVGSLAVALALQPTLSNFFAGLHIAVGRPIRVGDFVELETGSKGYVEDINWRETRIRELPNNLVVVPNSRVANMILTNYSLPVNEQSALVQVGVSYASDLERVEQITCEVARDVLGEVEGGVSEFAPFIRYHDFGESSINFSVILRVREFADRYLVTHEFIKRLKARYDQEGIEIPFPQRVVHTSQSDSGRPTRSDG